MVDPTPRPIGKVVIGWTAPEATVTRLRERFPEVRFEVALGDALAPALRDADVAVAWQLTEAEFTAAERLVWFQTIGAGVERALLPGMAERGVVVTNMSGIHAVNIAEHVLAMMLAFARRLPFLIRGQVRHEWRDDEGRHGVFEIAGQSLLVVGFGAIGRELARKAAALGMQVTGVRRSAGSSDEDGTPVHGLDALPGLLPSADHVAICLPQTRETEGLFDAAMVARCKPGAHLYNIGRGPIVATAAVVAALESGALGGVGLDVTDPEPLPADSPLWDRDDVIITAHTAGATPHFWPRIESVLLENIGRWRSGRDLINVVDQTLGY